MLKIVVQTEDNNTTTIRLEGRVIGPWVEELKRSCGPALARGARLTLDLSDVSFLDREGVELFQSLQRRQVAFLNCSAFVAELLKAGVDHGRTVGGR